MSLKDICKNRIVTEMIRRVRAAAEIGDLDASGAPMAKDSPGYCVMIVDDGTLRVLSSCCKVYDILEEGVTVVENIERRRQPLRLLDSIYFITPTKSSVDFLCKDFKNEKLPQYKSVHLFFSLPLGPDSDIMEMIAGCPGLISRLQTFVEFNLSFLTYESRVFHFDSPGILPKIFPPKDLSVLHHIAEQLLCVCYSLGDIPDIRFHSNNFALNQQLALILHEKFRRCQVQGLSHGKTLLVIVDRSIDIAPLFVHEYTYQAYLYDLLDIPLCTPVGAKQTNPTSTAPSGTRSTRADDTIEYPVVTNEGKAEVRTAVLGEEDEVYVRYRHQHIVVALKGVSEEIKKFLKENAAAKMNQRKDGDGQLSNAEMQRTIRDLPQYQEMLAKYTVHNSLTHKCYDELNRRGLLKVGYLEQDLVTGVDKDGKEVAPQKCLKTLGTLLSDESIGMEEKLRLFLLYFAMMDGVHEDDRRKMMVAAQLSLDNSLCINNFIKLGLDKAEAEPNAASSKHHNHKFAKDKDRLSFFAKKAKSTDIQLSRFQPYLKEVMEKSAQNNLHGGKFRYVTEPDQRSRFEIEPKVGTAHVRARNQDWDFGETPGTPEDLAFTQYPSSEAPQTKKVILFVIGGICLSEIRAAYEVSKQLNCEIYIGSTTILTPRSVLQSLKDFKGAGGGGGAAATYWQQNQAQSMMVG